jgi:hypothetical protein
MPILQIMKIIMLEKCVQCRPLCPFGCLFWKFWLTQIPHRLLVPGPTMFQNMLGKQANSQTEAGHETAFQYKTYFMKYEFCNYW